MYILYGTRSKEKKELWAGNATCPHCGQQSDFYTYRIITSLTLFFIPFFSFTRQHVVACENCNTYKTLKRKEYKALRREQFEKIESGTYPQEKAIVDFSPKNMSFTWETIKLIFKGLLALIMLSPLLLLLDRPENTLGETIFAAMFLLIPIGLIFILPFFLALRRYLELVKLKKVYDNLINR